MTPEESQLLVQIVELIVERKIQKYSLTKEKLAPTAFEERYMNHYTHGMFIDHVLFRKHLHELEQVGGVHFYETPEEMRAAADANDQSLYITKNDFGLWQYDAEKQEFVSLYEPFGIRIVNVLPTKNISDKCIYLVPKDDIAKESYELWLSYSGDDATQAVRELADVKGILVKDAQEIFDSLPNVVSTFENKEEAEAEYEKYTFFEKKIETVGTVKRHEVVIDGYDQDRKADAMKALRLMSGMSLKDAKTFVESLPAVITSYSKAEEAETELEKYTKYIDLASIDTLYDVVLTELVDTELADGVNKVYAVKEIREIMGWSLREAKDFVDSLPAVVSSFATEEEAKTELARYQFLSGKVKTPEEKRAEAEEEAEKNPLFTGHTNSRNDLYTEWVHTENGWELVGDDLKDYYTKSEIDEMLESSKVVVPKEVITVNECTSEDWYNGIVDLSDTSMLWVVTQKDASPLLMAYNGTQWATTNGETDTLYMAAESTNLYKWTINGLQLLTDEDEEMEDTLRIRSLDELDPVVEAGNYKVIYLQEKPNRGSRMKTGSVLYTYSAWTLSVESSKVVGGTSFSQTLTNKDGYMTRQGTQATGAESVEWGYWSTHLYAYTSDIHDNKLHILVNGLERGTFSANSTYDVQVELGANATMPDFAWWQKQTVNQGAKVLLTNERMCPLNRAPYWNGKHLPLLEVSQHLKQIEDADYSLHGIAKATFPEGTTQVFVENWGCSTRRTYKVVSDPSKGTIRVPVDSGRAYELTATFTNNANALDVRTQTLTIGELRERTDRHDTVISAPSKSIYAFNFPEGIEGAWTIEYTLKETLGEYDVHPQKIRFYCEAANVLEDNVCHSDSNGDDITERNILEANDCFFLLSVVNGKWHIQRYNASTVRVRRHWLECQLTSHGGVSRDTYRIFERPVFGTYSSDKSKAIKNLTPAFVRRYVHAISSNYGTSHRVMRWRAYDYTNTAFEPMPWFGTLAELPTHPFHGRSMSSNNRNGHCSWYLDCLLAEMRKGNQRPYIKSLCMHVRKAADVDLWASNISEGDMISKARYNFCGFREKPIKQF